MGWQRLAAGVAIVTVLVAAGGAWSDGPAPDAEASLRMPGTGHDVGVEYRQLADEDLADYRATGDVRSKQLQALLAFGGRLTVDVPFKVGERRLPAGRLPLAFTVDGEGDLRWFVVDGRDPVELPFAPLEPGYEAARLALQVHYVSRTELQLVWHLGLRGGSLTLRPGRDG